MAHDPVGSEEMAHLILDRERREASIVVRASSVDLKIVDPMERLLDEVGSAGVHRLELDLANVSFADSSIVRLAMKAQEFLSPKGAKVVIRAPREVRRVFDVTQTARLFEIVPAD